MRAHGVTDYTNRCKITGGGGPQNLNNHLSPKSQNEPISTRESPLAKIFCHTSSSTTVFHFAGGGEMSHVRKGSLRECSSAPVNLCAGCAEEALRPEPGSCASPSFLQMESDRERDCLGPRAPGGSLSRLAGKRSHRNPVLLERRQM